MKKAIIATLMISILMVTFCTNTNAQSHQNAFSLSHRPPMELKGGSWTINSTKYTASATLTKAIRASVQWTPQPSTC